MSKESQSPMQKRLEEVYKIRYRLFFVNVTSTGLILFTCGFFLFPGIPGVKVVFYLLILFPAIALLPIEWRNFPFKSGPFLLYMIVPLYLCLSHLWADEENITRNFLFFAKQVFFVYALLFGFWIAFKNNKDFLNILLIYMVVTGTIFAFVSLLQYLHTHNGSINSQLMGFSTSDSNKAGAFFTIHLALCAYFLVIDAPPHKSKKAYFLIIVACILDIILIILTKTKATWLIIPLIPIFVVSLRVNQKKLLITCISSIFIVVVIYWQNEILTLLQNMRSFKERIFILKQTIGQLDSIREYIFGLGLVYKLHVPPTIHPHNVFADTFRFGGIIGLLLLVTQISVVTRAFFLNKKEKHLIIILFWLLAGIILLSLYGQQPLTRPGYIWFLYWAPASIILASYLTMLSGSGFVSSIHHQQGEPSPDNGTKPLTSVYINGKRS